MNAIKRNYRATFILDNRGKEESIDQIVDGVKQDIAAVKGEVTAVEHRQEGLHARHRQEAHECRIRAHQFLRSGGRSRAFARAAAPERQRVPDVHSVGLSRLNLRTTSRSQRPEEGPRMAGGFGL
jgi:hypothetical protein